MANGTDAANLNDTRVGFVTKYKWYVVLFLIPVAYYFLFWLKEA